MHTPSPCSTRSVPSRLEWRPSRLRAGAQFAVLLAAPWLLAASALPRSWLGPAIALVWLLGGLDALRGLRRPPRLLWLTAAPKPLLLDSLELEAPTLQLRGPWTQLRWQGPGRRGHLLFWPGQLSRCQRRELRLALRARPVPLRPR